MKLYSSDIAVITKGKLIGPAGLEVSEFVIDSRQLNYSEGLVFIAIKGKNHDAHQFVMNLYEKGIRIFVVETYREEFKNCRDAAFIMTDNTVEALQLLASHKRKEFRSPVIAVTGSTGKTIVKEWLADILGRENSVLRSPKSYNSQIGVPLSVLRLDNKYTLGIFEAGISMSGEMEKLRNIIDPDAGVITNIGDAHSENFSGLKEKATEKLKLFRGVSKLVYCKDHEIIRDLILDDNNLRSRDLYDWSFKDQDARIFIGIDNPLEGKTSLNVSFSGNQQEFIIPFTDRASVENAATVASVCLALGTEPEIIRQGLASLSSVAMRMELRSGINDCRLIEDYYNSDPGSLGMAIDYLRSQKGFRTALILSDFVQSGRDERDLYGTVAEQVARAGIIRFIGIGPALSRNSDLFGNQHKFFASTDEFIQSFSSNDFRDEIILLKGARMFEFEKIANLLARQIHQTVLEVNLDALSHNLNEFRKYLDPGTRIMAMVKAFAYGAGPSEISGFLEYQRVSYLTVAYVDEGVELRNAGVALPIMVMNPDPASMDLMIKYNLEPEIYSFESLGRFINAAERHGLLNYPVHIKIDTGMHRLGFMPEDVPELALKLKNSESIRVMSVFSHLAGSDDPTLDHFTHRQAEVFINASDHIRNTIGYQFLRHILNSSGIIRFPQYQFEMVRPGIGMYGAGRFEGVQFKPVSRFKTRISQIKMIKAGDPVGYNCSDVADTDRDIAILPVGYADGFNRKLGNRNGNLFIKGVKVPVVGRVCMDMCMADVTGLNAVTGDEAEIFGENISIDELADKCGTIPYELLTSIPRRVKRVFYRE